MVLGLALAATVHANCALDSRYHAETVQLAAVLDGDTVRLADGRRIRLIGVNTPEIEHPPRPEEPLAVAATHQLEALLKKGPLYLLPGQQPLDHYGRTLGHLFAADGRNVIEELLKTGAGFQVAIPPNLAFADCYSAAQHQARLSSAGVWGHPFYAPVAADSPALKGGYARVTGRIEKVILTRKAVWVDLQGAISLKLERKDAEFLAGATFDQVVAASRERANANDLVLEARGWVVDRNTWGGRMVQQIKAGKRKPFQMKVQHASSWEQVPERVPGR